MTRIPLVVGDEILHATLDDSPAAQDFARLLPLALTLTDHADTEKVAELPRALSTVGAPARYAASAGDITDCAPWGNLATFHKDLRSARGLVRLGRLDGSVAPLRREGPVGPSHRDRRGEGSIPPPEPLTGREARSS